jgi:hypothetical protein
MPFEPPIDHSQGSLKEQLRAALGPALAGHDPAVATALVTLLADVVAGRIAADDAQHHVAAISGLSALLHELAGQELQVGRSMISFGAGSQIGDVTIGDVAGRDVIKLGVAIQQTIVSAEHAYNVRGLANPYLGLRAFTYADRSSFAGRERLVQETVERVTAPGDQCALLFVTGASGRRVRHLPC